MSIGVPTQKSKQDDLVARIIAKLAQSTSASEIAEKVSDLGPEAVKFVQTLDYRDAQ